jgi:hypothetical protein
MKRPSGLVLGILGGFVAFVVLEVIVWWPDAPKKRADEPAPEPVPTVAPKPLETPPPAAAPAALPNVAPAREGRTVHELKANENDEVRRLEGCSDKHCGDPCIFRCDPNEDGRCVDGKRPGACTVDNVCSTTLPAVCPGTAPP